MSGDAALRKRIDELEDALGQCYQLAGELGAPARVLDLLSAAARGKAWPSESFLPIAATECDAVAKRQTVIDTMQSVREKGGAMSKKRVSQDQMLVTVMVIEVKKLPGGVEGRGAKTFRQMPRTGEMIEFEDDSHKAQLYRVVAVHHPGELASTAGDVFVEHVGTTAAIIGRYFRP